MLPPQDLGATFFSYLMPILILTPLFVCALVVIAEYSRRSAVLLGSKINCFVSRDAQRNRIRAELMAPDATPFFLGKTPR